MYESIPRIVIFTSLATPRHFTFWDFLCEGSREGTLGARGFLREEPRSTISEAVKREKIHVDKRWENLWLLAPVDWSYCASRFELGSRSDPSSWLEEPYRCVFIGCSLIDLVVLIDNYRSTIVRFALPTTRGFLSPLLSLSCLVSLRQKKTSGTRVQRGSCS